MLIFVLIFFPYAVFANSISVTNGDLYYPSTNFNNNQDIFINYSFSGLIYSLQFYLTGPSTIGSKNFPVTIAVEESTGQIRVKPEELGGVILKPGKYKLYARGISVGVPENLMYNNFSARFVDTSFSINSSQNVSGNTLVPLVPQPITPLILPTSRIKSGTAIDYAFALVNYAIKLVVYERNPVGKPPIAPMPVAI